MDINAIEGLYRDFNFRSFVDVKELPIDGVVYAVVTDDCFDLDDYTYYRLTIMGGVVTSQLTLFDGGLYEELHFHGWALERLAKWSQVDNTGRHPEVVNELSTMFVHK